MALYTLTSKDEFAKLNRLPSADQTQMWNALGRNNETQGNDNFFAKRASSIENALGTTGAAAVGGINELIVNEGRNNMVKDQKTRMNDIAKKYGYNTYHDVWDARDKAAAEGDQTTLDLIDNTINPQLQAQANANANEMDKFASDYKDYVQNDYIGQKTNQDRGKFLGSAINTLSTASDVLGLTNGPIANAIQGGIEGVADELEQNGLENFDWQRAGQNALTGAASGAAVGMVNKGLSNALAKNGGNLFKGGNALTRGINDLGSKTALGRGVSTLATGAGRGAISGAVGGATGAGLSSALNSVDLGQGIANTFQGAVQGAGSGATTGAVMAGANSLINKTPFMQKVNQAQQDWQNSGDNFNERLANTYADDNGRLVNSKIGQKVGDWIDDRYTNRVNEGAKARLADALTQSIANEAQGGISGNTKFVRLTNDRIKDINTLREAQGFAPLDDRQVTAYENALNNNLTNRIKEGMTVNDVVNMAYESLMSPNAEALPGNVGTTNTMMASPYKDRFNSSIIDNFEGTTSLKSIEPRSLNKINALRQEKNGLLSQSGSPLAANQEGGVIQTSSSEGSTSLGNNATPLRTRGLIVPQNGQNVNTEPVASARTTWDDLAKEYGYNNYDEVSQRYMQANPNGNPDATDILDWLDKSTAPTNKDAARQRLRDIKADALRTRAAEDLLNQVGTAKAPAAKADNMVENVKQFMNEGLTKPEEWQLASDAITGANGVMSRLHRNLVSQAGDIDTYSGLGGKYGNTIDETIDYIIKAEGLVDSDAKGIKNEIMAVINSLPSRTDGSINMSDSADSVMSGIRELEAHRRNYLGEDSRNRSTTTPYKDQKARVIKKVTSMLEDRIYDNIPDAKTVVTQDAINELKSYFPGNSKWEASVDEKFNNIKTGKDLRAVQKRYVQTSDYLRNIKENYGTYGQRVGDAYGNALSQGLKKVPVVGGLLAQATNTPFMNRRYADINSARANRLEGNSFADSVSNIPSRKSTPTSAQTGDTTTVTPSPAPTSAQTSSDYNPATQIYNAIGRTEGLNNAEQARTANYLTEAANEMNGTNATNATLENLVTPTTNTDAKSVYNSVYGTQGATPQTFASQEEERAKYFYPPTGDYWADMLSQAMRNAKNAEDYEALGSLYEMYQTQVDKLDKQKTSTSEVKLTDKQRQANAAERALNDFEGAEHNFAYDVSDIPIIGGLANLGGNTYASKAEALALQIGYMLSGATVNKEEAKNIGMAYVPQPRDNEQVRQNKLAQLRGIISDYQRA